MLIFFRRLTPVFLFFITFTFIEAGITTDYSDAKSRLGGRSFSRTTPRQSLPPKAPAAVNKTQNSPKSSFAKGLAGGLLGGAIGGMLFGSLFGMGGSGMGILPLLLLGGGGYFLYRRFTRMQKNGPYHGNTFSSQYNSAGSFTSNPPPSFTENVPPPVMNTQASLEDGIRMIQSTDSDFDINYFKEVASDVFFQVQAGWMRRDLDSYQHLLGEQLAAEYEKHFSEMREQGHINKLENIAIRKIEALDAGSDGREDFITILFTANLLDYTVDDKTGKLVEGSMTNPIKFAEKWTWARPVNSEAWKLEGIAVADE